MKNTLALILLLMVYSGAFSQATSTTVGEIFTYALERGKAYEDLRDLCTGIGHRLSGSPQAAAAVEWATQQLIDCGADTVYLQPVMVPRWVRGDVESARVVSSMYGTRRLEVCSIGNTNGTRPGGILAPVVEVRSRAELHDLGAQGLIRGKIVFYNVAMDQSHVESGSAYGETVWIRSRGAHLAQGHGAVGVLIRSLSIEEDDWPHTGAVTGTLPTPTIPSVAASTNDANLLADWLRRDPALQLYIENNCRMLPEVQSYNVIAQVHGAEYPREIILAGAHLDSWDMGHGAHDDGAGVVQAIAVLRTFRELNIRPRHTVRIVLFMNEENGMRGAMEYARVAGAKGEAHLAALESDAGGFSPRGFNIDADEAAGDVIKSWRPLFEPYLIHRIAPGFAGVDIGPLKTLGTPLIGLMVDPQRYYAYHHSAADTFDKVNRRELEMGAAAMASMVYLIDTKGLP